MGAPDDLPPNWDAMKRASKVLDFYTPPAPKPTHNILPPRRALGMHPITRQRTNKLLSHQVYFIRSGEFVKIGIAGDVDRRLRTIQSHNPHDPQVLLVIPGGRPVERGLHQQFAADHHRDEWFRLSADILRFIAGHR